MDDIEIEEISKLALKSLPEITSIFIKIIEWYENTSVPNSRRAYHRCPVCDATWWDTERHEASCWIPEVMK